MAKLFNDTIRCYENGRVERLYKKKGWVEVDNTPNHNGYNRIGYYDKFLLRHRIIAACYLGLNIDDPTQEIDHINRVKTDNRVENLRIATSQQQKFNTGEHKGYSNRGDKYRAFIKLNKKQIHLGVFETEAEAHQAYLNAKELYHII